MMHDDHDEELKLRILFVAKVRVQLRNGDCLLSPQRSYMLLLYMQDNIMTLLSLPASLYQISHADTRLTMIS